MLSHTVVDGLESRRGLAGGLTPVSQEFALKLLAGTAGFESLTGTGGSISELIHMAFGRSPQSLSIGMLVTLLFSVSVVSDSLQPHGLHQTSLSITNSRSLLKLITTEWVMPSNHLVLCRPLLLLRSIFPSIRAFSNESAL